jgi:6-phosphofructokinase 1
MASKSNFDSILLFAISGAFVWYMKSRVTICAKDRVPKDEDEDSEFGSVQLRRKSSIEQKDFSRNNVVVHSVHKLSGNFPSANAPNDRRRNRAHRQTKGEQFSLAYNKLIGDNDFILADIVHKGSPSELKPMEAYIRAGPRKTVHFEPTKVRAAIVNCGGLCPGLNSVIHWLVRTLYELYDAEKVFGVVGGYNGFTGEYAPVELTLDSVADCHHAGGTMLASSRGGFDLEKIIGFLLEYQIDQLYIIGGDGTHRGANKVAFECISRGLNISVAGIPKTIDNDIDVIDRSFGFLTSVEMAQSAIASAKVEARCNLPNGIGVVKLMGRSAGFIAAYATLASGDVDLCLIPEVDIEVEGPNSCLTHLRERVKAQGYAVVVVAEGAGEELLGQNTEKDSGGNRKLPKIGEFVKDQVIKNFEQAGSSATVKYIDPSYMIRSVRANSSDAMLCMLLAQNAVHGSMAGYTAFTTGLVNNRLVYIPIDRIVSSSPRVMDPTGRTWERVLSMTGQPSPALRFDPVEISCNSTTVI